MDINNIDNERLFGTEDIDAVEELYEDMTEKFSIHTYDNKHYSKMFKELWGVDNWQEVFSSMYGNDLEEFKKDYLFEYLEFIGK